MAKELILKEMTGLLRPNKFHEKGDNQPSLKGEFKLNGKTMDVALWPPKPGNVAFFMKISEPYVKPNNNTRPQQQQQQTQSKPEPQPQSQPIQKPKSNPLSLIK